MATFRAEQFSVRVSDEVLADLRARIVNTRWPGPGPGAPWEQGTDLGYLRGLLGYWADGFDWRAIRCLLFLPCTVISRAHRSRSLRSASTGS